ncbi:putative UDP-N-acetylglucosamine pyrophosphorylase [Cyclospora cayetanensis]|uniref:UTP-monosaccharide-1-phosphate uridylyltransferase n=1 Tax=Cyclospora cayetanensis TaxID=88456 RepID=A0A1D3DAQ9_9EIME|nr:putative UDP-N-acetylglucosamine pyrophosphorylase [Cyclospora cayetanensis]
MPPASMEPAALKKKVIEELDQGHLFPPNTSPENEARLLKQLAAADASYPGGLSAYVSRSRQLLRDAKAGVNPFHEYTVSVPEGERIRPGTAAFLEAEEAGLKEIARCAFVVVAGGLGERLGYCGIKLSLPTNSCTGTTYIEYYCKFVQALQEYASQEAREIVRLPLAIMTSGDTHDPTVALFEESQYFGLDRNEVHFIQQQKVPALSDMDAHLATTAKDPYTLEMKPHGHGDVHSLLLRSGLLKRWQEKGIKWITLLQDTNANVMRVLMAVVGVSATKGLAMNTIAVPRMPGEAVGSICRLVSANRELTLNVEYNVLDSLLKAMGQGGDKPGPDGYSELPGNTNAIVLCLEPYANALNATGGLVPEFINPKFKDASKTSFKSPARLESMMQDLPLLLSSDDKVGFVEFPRWCCFSPVKNSLEDARNKAEQGLPPESSLSGESDLYLQNARWLQLAVSGSCASGDSSVADSKIGSVVVDEPGPVTFGGVRYQMGPRIILCPSWAISFRQMRERLQEADIEITKDSVLIVSGDVKIRRLKLNGALVLKASSGMV